MGMVGAVGIRVVLTMTGIKLAAAWVVGGMQKQGNMSI